MPEEDTMSLIFESEMSLACTYAMRRKELARTCAIRALWAAIQAKRPDWAFRANSLLAAL